MEIKPEFCCLAVTNRCMFKCRICYSWQNSSAEECPTLEQYKVFLSDLRELADDNFVINFAGGEALLFDGLLDLVKFSFSKGFKTSIASNGWLIDEQMARKIADSCLHEINLSLDGLNENTHDYIRGRKYAYNRVMAAIENLAEQSKSTKVCISCVICAWNLDELLPLADWAVNNDKINSIYFLAPMQPNYTEIEEAWWKGKYNYLWPNNNTDKACRIIDKLVKSKTLYPRQIGNQISQLEAFKSYFLSPGEFVKKKCNAYRALHVNAAGNIALCLRGSPLGNIKTCDNFKELWYSDRAQEVRQHAADCKENCHFLLNCF